MCVSLGFGHVWFFESCFADQGSETSYFTRFGAPLEKCKSKEGFGSGGSARWQSKKAHVFSMHLTFWGSSCEQKYYTPRVVLTFLTSPRGSGRACSGSDFVRFR